ncbi:MAG: hypothetical protein ACRDQ4_17175 [Pseudonocardiaceae bacterium]
MPSRFAAPIELQQPELTVWMDVIVDEAGARPRVVELQLYVDVRTSLTTSVMRRVLVDQLLTAALDEATVHVENKPGIHHAAFSAQGDPDDRV